MTQPDSSPWIFTSAVVVKGHRVASGLATDSPYPAGTIAMQMPVFQALGLDLSEMLPATLNLSLQPHRFTLVQPAVTFRQVAWTDRHPPEDFSFTPCALRAAEELYLGWVYYPHPATKARHFQDSTVIEVLAPLIPGLGYGSPVELGYDPASLSIY